MLGHHGTSRFGTRLKDGGSASMLFKILAKIVRVSGRKLKSTPFGWREITTHMNSARTARQDVAWYPAASDRPVFVCFGKSRVKGFWEIAMERKERADRYHIQQDGKKNPIPDLPWRSHLTGLRPVPLHRR
jgi:hypothetical protein